MKGFPYHHKRRRIAVGKQGRKGAPKRRIGGLRPRTL